MKSVIEEFLSEADRAAIETAVREAEMRTSGEIVPLVVPASYGYPAAAMRAGLLLGGAAALAIVHLIGRDDVWMLSALFIAFYLLLSQLTVRFPFLLRLFVRDAEMREEVEEAALTAFYRHGLDKTRDRTGVLLFISVFERKVHVLADSGINDRVEAGCWQEIVDGITAGIREGRQGEAISRAVGRCGDILSEHFPKKKDDRDELKNLIVEEG